MLPVALTRYFADSRLDFHSFSTSNLELRIEKDIGPETGIIRFREVSFVCLPCSLNGASIGTRPVKEADAAFWSRCLLEPDYFDPDDNLFEIWSQDGPVFYVVAKTLEYSVGDPQKASTWAGR
jgi:hypothetical protein